MPSGRTQVAPLLSTVALSLLQACASPVMPGPPGAPLPSEPDAASMEVSDAGRDTTTTTVPDAGGGGRAVDAGTAEVTPCELPATDYGLGMRLLDTQAGSSESLVFIVPGLPAPESILEAVLTFDSYDADHPGAEGTIDVNGRSTYDIPAMAGWDNGSGTGAIDITGDTIAGDNRITFHPNRDMRSLFGIADVLIRVSTPDGNCEAAAPPPAPGPGVARQMHFDEATYTNRGNWVVPCPPGEPGYSTNRNYAYTAYSDEHTDTDCSGEYVPGGNRTGTAIFRFEDVVPARYRVLIRSRHTENRNPAGALFVVNGVGQRIDQTTSMDYETDEWGEAMLGGTVEVVLDSTGANASDSVTWVRLEPL